MFKRFFIAFVFFSIILCFNYTNNSNNSFLFPLKNNKNISSEFGKRNLFNKENFHTGIDISSAFKTNIYAMKDGIVAYVGFDNTGYGNMIILLHSNGYKSLYAHIDENFLVNLGDSVSKGQLIAKVGPKFLSNGKLNGNTTGPHLHFTIYKDNKLIDPLKCEFDYI